MSEKFEYKYKAPTIEERQEIDSIRRQYLPKDEAISKIERLRNLDAKVKNIPLIFSLSLGVVGILLFGLSMTFFLHWQELWYIGIAPSLIGIVLMAFAYPCHNYFSKKYKEKYSQEIIDLSNELLNRDE